MEFLARKNELVRLKKALGLKSFSFIALWGRRRIGKSRLLLEWNKKAEGIYWVADESAPAVQRKYLAEAVSERFPGMNDVQYPDWNVFFKRLTKEIRNSNWRGPLIIDELPYLVSAAKELPSVLQNWIDLDLKPLGFTLVIAGSSQAMMQGLVLQGNSPLYGRATDIIKLYPLAPKYLKDSLGLKSPIDQIKAYTLWGGIPRYWELAQSYANNLEEAAHDLLLSPEGILSQEPNRLLLEESPSASSLRPVLDAIGMGSHKTSEIAGRLAVASTSLSKSLKRLQDLDLIKREIPFGESEKSSKRSLYKIKDPLFRIWFELISGRRGQIASLQKPERIKLLNARFSHFSGHIWEDLCRKAFLRIPQFNGKSYLPPTRYWQGNGPEWDLITTTEDKKTIIIGECKWFGKKTNIKIIKTAIQELIQKGIPPISKNLFTNIEYCLFVPEIPSQKIDLTDNVHLIDAETVLRNID